MSPAHFLRPGPRHWPRATVAGLAFLVAHAWGAEAPKPRAEQSLSEFLDELSDNALSTDPGQIYRVDGQRRYVRLGAGWAARASAR
jgi:hypothetical protein